MYELKAHPGGCGGTGVVGGTRGLVAHAVIALMLIVFAAFCCTLLSAAGMGLRYPARGVVPG